MTPTYDLACIILRFAKDEHSSFHYDPWITSDSSLLRNTKQPRHCFTLSIISFLLSMRSREPCLFQRKGPIHINIWPNADAKYLSERLKNNLLIMAIHGSTCGPILRSRV